MNILLTGSTGFIGQVLCSSLTGNVELLTRTPDKTCDYKYYIRDLSSSEDFSSPLLNKNVVIHLAAINNDNEDSPTYLDDLENINVQGTLNLARQAAKFGVKRFIFLSSIKVNDDTSIKGPLFYDSPYQPACSYGRSKVNAEKGLRQIANETGLEVVIIRPTLVYGPGVKANFESLMRLVSKGIPLPFGCINDNRRSLVSLTNIVDLIVTCVDHPNAGNQTFLVSDDNDVSTSQMVRQMAFVLDKPTWQLPLPVWFYRFAGKLLGKSGVVDRLIGSLQVDITHTKEKLGWKPPQSLEEGFKEAAQALLNSKK